MRRFQAPSVLLYAAGILAFTQISSAKPFWWPKDTETTPEPEAIEIDQPHNITLELRSCANPCGWYGQLCCETGQTCYTDANNQAQCGGTGSTTATAAGGYWQYYTTTYVETNYATKTTVISSYFPGVTVAATSGANPTCNYALNESPCGSICCASGQYCLASGQCAAAGGGSSEGYAGGLTTASAAVRPTTGTGVVVTATLSPTTTVPFQTPVATGATVPVTGGESSGGLSGGAIAGIVIGVLAALALLFLLCFFCCAKAVIDFLAAIFGRRKKRTHETEVIEEYHHHSGSTAAAGAAGVAGGRRWYGNRPSRPDKPKKGGIGAVAAGLGALAVGLGLKRKYDKEHGKTDYTGSSYEYSYYTGGTSDTSSSSGDRRTRRSSRH